MPNIFSKPTDKGQRTIDIYKANTSQGVFSGWGLSSLQQHNPTYNSYNNGTGTQNIFSGNGNTFSNSLNTTVGSGTGTNNSSLATTKGNWGLPSTNRYRRDNVGSKSNYNNSSYNNGDHQEILAKQRKRYEEKNPNAKKRHKVDNMAADGINLADVVDMAFDDDDDDDDYGLPALRSNGDESDYDSDDSDDDILEIIDSKNMDRASQKSVSSSANDTLSNVEANLVKKRNNYTDEQKKAIIGFWDAKMAELGPYAEQKTATSALNANHPAWQYVTTKMIMDWKQKFERSKDGSISADRGRKRCPEDFYTILRNKLWMKIVVLIHSKNEDGEDVDVRVERIINCCYSYDIIHEAAKEAKKEWLKLNPHLHPSDINYNEREVAIEIMHEKEFKNKWIHSYLVDYCMHRRKISTGRNELKIPSDTEIRKVMEHIQKFILDGKYPPSCIFSADETAINWDAALNYQYVTSEEIPSDIGDDKLRFTAMIATAASGSTMPPFMIMRCHSADPWDLKGTKVIQNLKERLDRDHPGRFEEKMWSRPIPFYNSKTRTTTIRNCCRPYLVDTKAVVVDGTEVYPVITCQNKAWMDQIGLIMWADVMLGNFVKSKEGHKIVIVWDNVSSHLSVIVKKILKEDHGIETVELPKNMTSILQVCDLIINGPLKADQRRVRAKALYDYFQTYANEVIAYTDDEGISPSIQWNPTRMSLADGLLTLIGSINSFNSRPEFREAVSDCFTTVGIVPKDNGEFNYYSSAAPHRFQPSPLLMDKDIVSLDDSTGNCKFKPNETFDLVLVESDSSELADRIDKGSNGTDLSLIHISEPTRPY